jgi:hypothetical protein
MAGGQDYLPLTENCGDPPPPVSCDELRQQLDEYQQQLDEIRGFIDQIMAEIDRHCDDGAAPLPMALVLQIKRLEYQFSEERYQPLRKLTI